ncbi:outer membrane lipoprotein carrier protein LolA [Polynucleobacter sp. MWH-Braz-FAM2G]|uniref:LolA family protein n=1 Tax=Polynucleobacter sp. MWH-Braz-FAM2G TaxID=1855883 RepID=UPI001BFD0D74|nr:outer membrane lipoprotein carrier protein LolA [Polynucleobacter sp. MWH-Braz-FAM2G]QWD91638.1 outer membrane lipoprotein carrier protein LolA [Polynucleobacter sp. MWH-Braz-FAM2G]
MNNSITRVLLACLLCFSGHAFADSLLNQIEGMVGSAQTVRGKFVQTKVMTGISKRLVSDGNFIVDKTQGVLWVTEKPIYQKLRVSNSSIKIDNKSGNLMALDARSEPSVRYINELVLAVFSGDLNALDRLFSYTGEASSRGWAVELTPKSAASAPFKRITMAGGSTISRITFISKDGDSTEISFSDVRPAASLTKDEALQLQ